MIYLSRLALLALVSVACAESNPYKDRYRQTESSRSLASSSDAAGEDNGAPAAESGGEPVAANTSSVPPAQDVAANAADTEKVAPPESIPPAALNATQIVCASQANLPKFEVELGVLCLNGEPTATFANLLSTAYQGTGTPQPILIKADNVQNVSTLIIGTSYAVKTPIMTAFDKRAGLNALTFTEGSATFTSSLVSATPGQGGMDLGSAILRQNVQVSIISDISINEMKFLNLQDKMVIGGTSQLKEGEADNNNNMLGNLLTFFIADGESTKVLAIAHQKIANRGQPALVQSTAVSVARRMTIEGYNVMSK